MIFMPSRVATAVMARANRLADLDIAARAAPLHDREANAFVKYRNERMNIKITKSFVLDSTTLAPPA